MIEFLLHQAITSIEALKSFFIEQEKTISRYCAKRLKKNVLPLYLDLYTYYVLDPVPLDNEGNPEGKVRNEKLSSIKAFIEKYFDIFPQNFDENQKRGAVQYRYKDIESLRIKGYELDLTKAKANFDKYFDMPTIHVQSTLMLIVVRVEDFLSSLFTYLIKTYPHAYLDKKSMTYADIVKLEGNITDYLIETEVIDIMRLSFADWQKKLEMHGFSFKGIENYIEKYKEMVYRRNLFVHNCGKVNHIYFSVMKNYCDENKIKIGDQMEIDKQYIMDSFVTAEILIYALSLEAIRVDKENATIIINDAFQLAFNSLSSNDWLVSEHVYSRLAINEYQNNRDRLVSTINFLIARKHIYGKEDVRQRIDQIDFTAFDSTINMARLMILEEFDEAVELLDKVFLEDIGTEDIRSWPLFIEFRESRYYADFVERHKADFDMQEISTEDGEKYDKLIDSVLYEDASA